MLCRVQHVSCSLRNLSTSTRASANHYDVLGITPKATQRDIKSAYYKLSKVYHPDKSPDEVSARKFRAISEAYEVLGNVNLKKMYDKGLIVGRENTSRMGWQPEPEPTDPTLRFYKSRENRQVTPNMGRRTPVYDFDACSGQKDKFNKTYEYLKAVQQVLRSKSHYGDMLAKAKYEKEFARKQRIKQQEQAISFRSEATVCLVILMGGAFMMLLFNIRNEYDVDQLSKNRSSNSTNSNIEIATPVSNAIKVEMNNPLGDNEKTKTS